MLGGEIFEQCVAGLARLTVEAVKQSGALEVPPGILSEWDEFR